MYTFSSMNSVRKLGECLHYYCCCCSSDGSEFSVSEDRGVSSTSDTPSLIQKYGELAVLG
jgi:hypothetical protein